MMSDDPRLVGDRLQFDVDLAKPLLPARAMRQRRVRPLCEQRLLICTGCHGAPASAHGDDEPLDGIPRASPPHQATSVPRPARKLRGGKPRRKTVQSDPATTTTPLRCGCCVKALWCCVLRRRGRSGAGGGRVRRTEQVARLHLERGAATRCATILQRRRGYPEASFARIDRGLDRARRRSVRRAAHACVPRAGLQRGEATAPGQARSGGLQRSHHVSLMLQQESKLLFCRYAYFLFCIHKCSGGNCPFALTHRGLPFFCSSRSQTPLSQFLITMWRRNVMKKEISKRPCSAPRATP
jgi:hypothetical protein